MDLFLGFTSKGLISMEIFVHPYIPMILPTSSQCGTLVVYPTYWKKELIHKWVGNFIAEEKVLHKNNILAKKFSYRKRKKKIDPTCRVYSDEDNPPNLVQKGILGKEIFTRERTMNIYVEQTKRR